MDTQNPSLAQAFGQRRAETEGAQTGTPQTGQSLNPTLTTIPLGTKVPKPTKLVRGMKGIRFRVSPVMGSMWAITFHYDEVLKRTLECFDNECCKYCGPAKTRFIIPVVEYTTDREGRVVDPAFEINYFKLGGKDYENFANLLSQIEDPTKVDFFATCSSSEYNTFDFVDIRNEVAVWRQIPEFEAAVLEKAKKVLPLMVPMEVTKIPRDTYIHLRAQAAGQVPQAAQQASGANLGQMIGK